MLIREHDDTTLSVWNPTERIDGVMYPPNIEELWSDEELRAAKLYRPERFAAPINRTTTGAARFEKSGNVVREVYDTVPVVITADQVKGEAQRRIILLVNQTNLQDCIIKELNALMRAGELTDKRATGGVLTPAEETEADTLRTLAARVRAIRAASDAIEALNPIPTDYNDNRRWP